jgi:hypothetical protein
VAHVVQHSRRHQLVLRCVDDRPHDRGRYVGRHAGDQPTRLHVDRRRAAGADRRARGTADESLDGLQRSRHNRATGPA